VRVISGTFKGKTIPSPPGNATRPTADIIKESIFSVLEHHTTIESSIVLDLCAGTGQMSWEALSRGAQHATLVDASVIMCKHLRQVAQEFGVNERVTIIRSEATAFAIHGQTRDANIIFIDPPYALKLCNTIALSLSTSPIRLVGTIGVFEHGDQEAMLDLPKTTTLWHRERGGTVVDILRYDSPLP